MTWGDMGGGVDSSDSGRCRVETGDGGDGERGTWVDSSDSEDREDKELR